MRESSVGVELPTPWRYKRYFFFSFLTAVIFILPWIKINDSYFFLLSFDKLKLHLAFVQFDMYRTEMLNERSSRTYTKEQMRWCVRVFR